jgi:hypothetical protein
MRSSPFNKGLEPCSVTCELHTTGTMREAWMLVHRQRTSAMLHLKEGIVRQTITWPGALTAAGLLVVFVAVLTIPQLLYPTLSNMELQGITSPEKRVELQQAQSKLQNDLRTILLQGLGGLLLTAGAVATWRQLHVSREGQITDRFTRAIDQLGDDKLDVQLGGIYALERIAIDSITDRSTISRILAAFIRTHAPWPPRPTITPTGSGTATDGPQLRWLRDRSPAVDAALGVLIRQHDPQGDREMHLPLTDLRGSYLVDSRLPGAWLRYANLAGSIMHGIHLEGGQLQEADLRSADLSGAHLEGAKLISANLEDANLVQVDLRNANLRNAKMRNANLAGADLRGANLDGADLEGSDLSGIHEDATTRWPTARASTAGSDS